MPGAFRRAKNQTSKHLSSIIKRKRTDALGPSQSSTVWLAQVLVNTHQHAVFVGNDADDLKCIFTRNRETTHYRSRAAGLIVSEQHLCLLRKIRKTCRRDADSSDHSYRT